MPLTCCAFDKSQELLWTGTEYGRLASFYGAELQRYTSYRGHAQHEGAVKQILPFDKGVLSVNARSLHLAEKRGRTIWHLTNRDFHDLRCVCFTSKISSEVVLAGCQQTMFVVDVEKGEIVQSKPTIEQYTMMKRGGQYICAATATGSVQIIDPKSLDVIKTWKAHMGWVNDMDANSSFLVTCGYSPRQHFGNMPDPLVKVFDLKTLMPLPPVQFHAGASFIRMHPRMLTTSIVASQTGLIQVVDIMNSTMVNVRQVNIIDTFLTSLDVATSGEALALTDGLGFIHLWGSPTRMHYSDYSTPTDFADDLASLKTTIDWHGNVPLNTVGMPYYRETLLSSWPSHLVFEVGAPPTKLDSAIAASLTRHPETSGAYAPNPRKTRRNQATDTRPTEMIKAASGGPRFLSEQARDGEEEQIRRMSDALKALNVGSDHADDVHRANVPKLYQNVEIQYSKFGVDDFDFGYYNNTKFSGLETHISNSYANPLLQLLRFTPWIRNLALLHTAGDCLFEGCLLCELGFLIDMLEKANGQNCQATNFLKTFGSLSHAASLGLLEDGVPVRPLSLMIQATNRFFLEKFAADYRQTSPQAHMDKVLVTAAISSIRCGNCMNETMRPGGTCVHELVYPVRPVRGQPRSYGPTFSQVLKASVERQDQTRGWCDRCKRYQQLNARKTIQSTPPVLTINAAIHNADAKQLWAKPGWLPAEIGIIVEGGQFFCYEGQDLELHIQRGAFQITVYELVGLVAEIDGGEAQLAHLVSLINITPSLREKQEESRWHIFNDFSVHEVPEDEALQFDPSWKLPTVLMYQVKSARHTIDDSWKEKLSTELLYRNSLLTLDDPSKFCPLDPAREHPHPGTVVGIDAEFVMMQQEELQIKVDGSKALIRPPRLALGRISVLRGGILSLDGKVLGETDLSCVPFIDDYIQVTEPIVDHLTEYSGIRPGDLDPETSRYLASGRLISLKLAYKKIWLLLNLGCIFVGHGLAKDFRTINIQIPREQVIDTVNLFYDKARARKLSLRFLSWYLLGEMIQQETVPGEGPEFEKLDDPQAAMLGHDSVVDAKMALLLWNKWRELESHGLTEHTIEVIYRKGRELNFKPPGVPTLASATVADAPTTAAIGITSTPSTPARKPGSLMGSAAGRAKRAN